MVCKHVSTCNLYQKDGVTCNRDNGGPFTISFFGKLKIKAYCGKWNLLAFEQKLNKKVVLVEA